MSVVEVAADVVFDGFQRLAKWGWCRGGIGGDKWSEDAAVNLRVEDRDALNLAALLQCPDPLLSVCPRLQVQRV